MKITEDALDREIRERAKPLKRGEFLRLLQRKLEKSSEMKGGDFNRLVAIYAELAGYARPKPRTRKEKKSKAETESELIIKLEEQMKRG
jgi:hypothetical protein